MVNPILIKTIDLKRSAWEIVFYSYAQLQCFVIIHFRVQAPGCHSVKLLQKNDKMGRGDGGECGKARRGHLLE